MGYCRASSLDNRDIYPWICSRCLRHSCLITAFFAWLGLSYLIQLLVFAIVTGAMTLGIRPIVLKHINKNKEKAKTNVDALIGQTGMVTEAIDSSKGMGYVKVGGETWRAVTSDDTYVGEGERVRIKDIEGCKVIVEIIPKK